MSGRALIPVRAPSLLVDAGLCATLTRTRPGLRTIWLAETGPAATRAKRICEGCPVKAECLDHAITHRETAGIWGGLNTTERAPLMREAWKEAQAQTLADRAEFDRTVLVLFRQGVSLQTIARLGRCDPRKVSAARDRLARAGYRVTAEVRS